VTQQPLVGMEQLAIRQPSVEEILFLAVDKGAGIDAIERLVALKQSMDAKQSEQEFNDNMNLCQREMQPVRTNAENPETHSKYATYKQLDNALRPIYSKFGFSISFSTTDCPIPEYVRVLAYVSRGGYTRTYQCDISSDGKGPKGGAVMSKTHASGSAMSYGMRYLLKMIWNVSVGEDDDDGNGGEIADWAWEYIDAFKGLNQVSQLRELFAEAWKKACGPNGDRRSKDHIRIAYEKRKKELA
jgi:hypothetical protein